MPQLPSSSSSIKDRFPDPHPDCRAPHKDYWEYTGPTHACAGPGCQASEHRTQNGYDRTQLLSVPQPPTAADGMMPQAKEEHRATATAGEHSQHLY